MILYHVGLCLRQEVTSVNSRHRFRSDKQHSEDVGEYETKCAITFLSARRTDMDTEEYCPNTLIDNTKIIRQYQERYAQSRHA